MKSLVVRFVYSLMIMIMLFSVLGLFGAIESTHTIKDCTVAEIENNTITVTDNRNNEWKFFVEDSELVVGDSVDLVMDNNHTDYTITDDEIKRVK